MSDEMIRCAAEAYEQVVLASLPDDAQWNHPFSPGFERKMKALCRRQEHPGVHLALRRVACIILALLIGFCMLMAFNGEVRASVIDWVKKQYETFNQYSFLGEAEDLETNAYDLGLVPEGYTLWKREHGEQGGAVVYRNDNGQLLHLNYMFNYGAGAMAIGHENSILKTATVGKWPADLHVSQKAGVGSVVVWVDEDNQVMFALTAQVEEDMLLEMAESTYKTNVYALGLVPEGYTLWKQEYTEEDGLVVYRNNAGQLLHLYYQFNIGGSAFFLDHEDCILKTATVGKWPADLYVSQKAGVGSKLVWVDEDNQVMFVLSAQVEEDMLLEMAESIYKTNTYALGLVPEGYTLWKQVHREESGLVIYRNDADQLLHLYYRFNIGGGAMVIDHEDCILKTATVGKWPADLYVSQKADVGSTVVWVDEDNQVMFTLSAKVEEDMLLEMAEKVFVKK